MSLGSSKYKGEQERGGLTQKTTVRRQGREPDLLAKVLSIYQVRQRKENWCQSFVCSEKEKGLIQHSRKTREGQVQQEQEQEKETMIEDEMKKVK